MYSHDIFMYVLLPLPHSPKKLRMVRKFTYFIRYTHLLYYLSCARLQLEHLVLFWGEKKNRGRVGWFALCSSVTKNESTSYHTRRDPGSSIHTIPFKQSRNSTGASREGHRLQNQQSVKQALPSACLAAQTLHPEGAFFFFLIISMF